MPLIDHAIYDIARDARGYWLARCECGHPFRYRRLESRAHRDAAAHLVDAALTRIEAAHDRQADPLGYALAVCRDGEIEALISTAGPGRSVAA